jgi:phospholipid N-methyltransferase
LAEKLIEPVDFDQAKLVVEVGPGHGAVTRVIRDRLRSPEQYLGIEISRTFVKEFQRRFPDLRVVHGSAEHLSEHLKTYGYTEADFVVCGVPWAVLSLEKQKAILNGICSAIRPGGGFSTIAYASGTRLPSGERFLDVLKETFPHVEKGEVVWKNVPPAYAYHCRKDLQ